MVHGKVRLLPAAMCGGVLAVSAIGAGTAWARPADPPGNNGTVKVDDQAFDDDPNNEPHVDCVFQIDFDGYDEGDLTASATFEAVPPTVSAPELLIHEDIAIGGDPAGGANDNDASVVYDLTNALVAIDPHPVQGWHVKLTVHAEGSQGADVKHKVFWVEGCEVPPGSTTTTTSTTTPGNGGSSTTTSTTRPGNGHGKPTPTPAPTPPAAQPVEPDGPIILAG